MPRTIIYASKQRLNPKPFEPYDWETCGDFLREDLETLNYITQGLKNDIIGNEYNDHVYEILIDSYKRGKAAKAARNRARNE